MTKRFLSLILIVTLVFSVFSNFSISALSVDDKTVENSVLSKEKSEFADGVLIARFENMLNHNYLYNDAFGDDKQIIENSIVSLLDFAEDGEIEKDIVINFIANMYGRQVDENAVNYEFAPVAEDKFFVLPKGYNPVSHEILSVTEDDGAYIVVSEMTVNTHDGEIITNTVKTVFLTNSGSCYGFNIISSQYFEAETTL